MRVEHLKRWLATALKAQKENEKAQKEAATTTERSGMIENGETSEAQTETETDNWTRVLDLVQSSLWEGKLAEVAMWQTVVLITKGKKDYRGIGLGR